MKGQWFTTHYPPDPSRPTNTLEGVIHTYGGLIYAKNRRHADLIAKQRRLGERVVVQSGPRKRPEPLASELLAKRRLTPAQKLEAIHAAVFLGYLLQRAHRSPAHHVLGDEGLVHQVVHSLLYGFPRRRELVAVVRYFERLVPGHVAR